MDYLIDDSDQLKLCPFCGAVAEIVTLEGEDGDVGIGAQCVQCTACGSASGLIYPLMDDVTNLLYERWNRRQNGIKMEWQPIEIEQLTARVRELEAENAKLKTESRDASLGLNDYYGMKLAAEQLNNKLLREALTTCVCAMQDYQAGIGITEMFDKGERLGRKALAQPSDTSALDSFVAEKVKEEMK